MLSIRPMAAPRTQRALLLTREVGMYGLVLVAALSAGDAAPQHFFGRNGGLYGGCYGYCYGGWAGFSNGGYGGYGGWSGNGCYGGGCYGGGCYGGYAGCWGAGFGCYGCCGGFVAPPYTYALPSAHLGGAP